MVFSIAAAIAAFSPAFAGGGAPLLEDDDPMARGGES